MSKILSLPREIVIDIISRLPISSLLQIKLVCKSWRQLLQDPYLPSLHFSRHISTTSSDPCLILQSRNSADNELYFLDFSSIVKEAADDHHHAGDDTKLKKLVVPPATNLRFVVLGSCRGILCLANMTHRVAVHLYNPLLPELKGIPKTRCGPNYTFGFGFHPETSHYKLVTIVAVVDRASLRFRTNTSPGSVVSVMTLTGRTGTRLENNNDEIEPVATSWRRLGLVPYHFIHQTHQVQVSSRLHWAAVPKRTTHGGSKKKCVVVSFDLLEETVREVAMPVSMCECERNCKCRFELMVVGSCLGIVEYYNNVGGGGGGGGGMRIWVMKDYGVEESWVEEIRIDGVDDIYDAGQDGTARVSLRDRGSWERRSCSYFHGRSDFRVLWVMRNGEVVLEYKRRGLVRYDPRNGSFRDVLSQGDEGLFVNNGFNAFVHEGSFCEIDACINM